MKEIRNGVDEETQRNKHGLVNHFFDEKDEWNYSMKKLASLRALIDISASHLTRVISALNS